MKKKSDNALKTIREVADIVGVEQHVLRFWETKFEKIKPIKRKNGRRYYSASDIEALLLVKRLLHEEGYTIKGAVAAMKSGALTAAPTAETALQKGDSSEQSSANKAIKEKILYIKEELGNIRKLLPV